jgi:hypothetical protein
VDLTAFRLRFPEFQNVDGPQIQAFLDDAATRINAGVFGDSYDAAHGYLTAHMISVSPFMQTAKLQEDDALTTYLKEFRAIRNERGTTPVVT